MQASNNWFSLDDNISFPCKAPTFQNAEAQLVFFEQESWCFKFLEPSEHFEIDHVVFFMVNWIIQRNATNEKASLSSLQMWCDLHNKIRHNLITIHWGLCTHIPTKMINIFPSILQEHSFPINKDIPKLPSVYR